MSNLSSLAKQVAGVRDPKLGRTRTPWGFLVHTTGGGITALAKKQKRRPIDVAIETYIASQNGSNGYLWGGPHYVLEHDGTLHQIAPDDVLTAHAGGGNRTAYIDGTWVDKCSPPTVAAWREQWPNHKHPYQLFPSKSPNNDYVGIECIPIGEGLGGEPMVPCLRFTKAQNDAFIALGQDFGSRHGWPAGWPGTSRLLGHEDVDPINRHDPRGGWDPGWLREAHYFDFEYVRVLALSPA